jgi:hypothetical protein
MLRPVNPVQLLHGSCVVANADIHAPFTMVSPTVLTSLLALKALIGG